MTTVFYYRIYLYHVAWLVGRNGINHKKRQWYTGVDIGFSAVYEYSKGKINQSSIRIYGTCT